MPFSNLLSRNRRTSPTSYDEDDHYNMAPSLNSQGSFLRPNTGDGRPRTRGENDQNLVIPSRTSSLHSRITQPIPGTLNVKQQQRTPKTLTHAYMVCGVGREPSQWVKAPAPAQGKIGHMKGAVGQFWLPEILGSSPRLEQDNEIARALHSAMRVRTTLCNLKSSTNIPRLVSHTMLRSARGAANHTASTTPSSSSRIRHTPCTVSRSASGRGPMTSVQRRLETSAGGQRPTSTRTAMRHTGSHTACHSCRDIHFTTFWATISVACGFTGTRRPIFSTPRRSRGFSASQHQD